MPAFKKEGESFLSAYARAVEKNRLEKASSLASKSSGRICSQWMALNMHNQAKSKRNAPKTVSKNIGCFYG